MEQNELLIPRTLNRNQRSSGGYRIFDDDENNNNNNNERPFYYRTISSLSKFLTSRNGNLFESYTNRIGRRGRVGRGRRFRLNNQVNLENDHDDDNNNNNDRISNIDRISKFDPILTINHPNSSSSIPSSSSRLKLFNYYQSSSQLNFNYNYNCNQRSSKKLKCSRFKRSKEKLVKSLLRAPVISAACFSLLLVLSLIILFGLSLHSHHKHQLELQQQQQQQQHYPQESSNDLKSNNNNDKFVIIHKRTNDLSEIGVDERAREEDEEEDDAEIVDRELYETREFVTSPSTTTTTSTTSNNNNHINNKKQQQQQDQSSNEIIKKPQNHDSSSIGGPIFQSSFERSLTVQTECGSYVGVPDTGAIAFRSIPYASPPVGRRRWLRPRPIWLDENLCKPSEIIHLVSNQNRATKKKEEETETETETEIETGTEGYRDKESDMDRDIERERKRNGNGRSRREYNNKTKTEIDTDSKGKEYKSKVSYCAQLSPITRRFTGHEDCLYLDIYTPLIRDSRGDQTEKLPVMVYIHGGFLSFGSSGSGQVNWMKSHPSAQLASDLRVVIVAFNYRLQALGFLRSTKLAKNNGPDGSEGNYGLWDQLVALNWIKRNIESFSGDPNNIVIFGPDSASSISLALITNSETFNLESINLNKREEGNNDILSSSSSSSLSLSLHNETSVSSSMISSNMNNYSEIIDSHRLFRAIWLTNPTVYYKSNMNENRFLSKCNNNNNNRDNLIECLLKLNSEQITRAFLNREDPSDRMDDQNCLPVHGIKADQFVDVDNELVTNYYPFNIIKTNESSKLMNTQKGLDILLGSTAQAVEFWPCPRNLHNWSWKDFEHYVSTSLNTFDIKLYDQVKSLYKILDTNNNNNSNVTPKEIYLTMVSDIRQICPINKLSIELAESTYRHRVKRYIVETSPSKEASEIYKRFNQVPRFAFHTWDLQAFMGFPFGYKITEKDLKFQKNLRDMVKEFVYNTNTNTNINNKDNIELNLITNLTVNKGYVLFTKDGQIMSKINDDIEEEQQIENNQYKWKECKFWNQHIGDSYAWLS